MTSINQAIYIPGSNTYKFSPTTGPTLSITDAPADTNWPRWAILHDGINYRLYTFKGSSPNTLYQFGWNGEAYQYGYNSEPELTIHDIPEDTDISSVSMTFGESNYRLYFRQLGNPTQLYQFEWDINEMAYVPCPDEVFQLPILGFPADTDWNRWSICNSGEANYHLYTGKLGSSNEIYQGGWTGSAYEYGGNNTYNVLSLENLPSDSNFGSLEVLHDGTDYRLYLQTL